MFNGRSSTPILLPSRRRRWMTPMITDLLLLMSIITFGIGSVSSMSLDRLALERNELAQLPQVATEDNNNNSPILVDDLKLTAAPNGGNTDTYMLVPASVANQLDQSANVIMNTIENVPESSDSETDLSNPNSDMLMLESDQGPAMQIVALPSDITIAESPAVETPASESMELIAEHVVEDLQKPISQEEVQLENVDEAVETATEEAEKEQQNDEPEQAHEQEQEQQQEKEQERKEEEPVAVQPEEESGSTESLAHIMADAVDVMEKEIEEAIEPEEPHQDVIEKEEESSNAEQTVENDTTEASLMDIMADGIEEGLTVAMDQLEPEGQPEDAKEEEKKEEQEQKPEPEADKAEEETQVIEQVAETEPELTQETEMQIQAEPEPEKAELEENKADEAEKDTENEAEKLEIQQQDVVPAAVPSEVQENEIEPQQTPITELEDNQKAEPEHQKQTEEEKQEEPIESEVAQPEETESEPIEAIPIEMEPEKQQQQAVEEEPKPETVEIAEEPSELPININNDEVEETEPKPNQEDQQTNEQQPAIETQANEEEKKEEPQSLLTTIIPMAPAIPQQQQQQSEQKPLQVLDSVLNYVNASFMQAETDLPKVEMETETDSSSTFNAHLRRYDGAQVWRIVVQTDKDKKMADELQTKYDGQLWKEVKQEVDYLLKPQVLAAAERHIRAANLSRIVLIDNLQQVIEVENPPAEKIAELQNRKGHRLTWQAYHRLEDIHGFIDYMAKTYPDICSTEIIGYSVEKRPLKILKISNGNSSNPGIWIDGGMHAREWISPATVTFMANQLIEGWEDLPEHMRNINWFIHPVANPDGYEYSHTTDRLWRKNMRAHGRQCPGVDLNRNFGYKWGGKGTSASPCAQTYRGSKAFSEPETFYISKFISGYPRETFQAYLSFHSYGQYILYPWGYDYHLTQDRADLDRVARQAGTSITKSTGVKYTVGSSATTLYPAAGGSDDWAKGIAGIKYAYTIEMGDTGRYGFVLPARFIQYNGKDGYTFANVVARAIAQGRNGGADGGVVSGQARRRRH
ncbi:uncharacterized protein Dwil_GK25779 [Drosophila willistoni]|uniref:Peptidase M14 domain-containing protein n=1 Tax=Drosophila willistoni TaxID=7260 RepID=B4NC32_DROWI|nr:uncharacterized protein Dwil_GK25779 [Drosophila willistoni]